MKVEFRRPDGTQDTHLEVSAVVTRVLSSGAQHVVLQNEEEHRTASYLVDYFEVSSPAEWDLFIGTSFMGTLHFSEG